MPRALITGVTGQDGSYLAEFLLERGYEVIGMVRRTSTVNFDRIHHIQEKIEIVQGDLLDQSSMMDIIAEYQPDEVYNLAAQSFVPTSWKQPVLTGEFTALGVTRLLEAIRLIKPDARFYQASSSEMFGKAQEVPQSEKTPFYPRSPYGVAKVYGHWITVNYRESYGIFAVSGILFNHESVPGWTPVLVRVNGFVDLLPIEELFPNHTHQRQRALEGVEVWEDGCFVKVLAITAYPHNSAINDKGLTEVESRNGYLQATREHLIYMEQGEVEAGAIRPGMRVVDSVRYPDPPGLTRVTPEWARFLGAFVGDGYAGWSEGRFTASFRNDSPEFRREIARLWQVCTGGTTSEVDTVSGYTGERKPGGTLNLLGAPGIAEWLATSCYTKSRHKRVPRLILNADRETWRHFLTGYNLADGLKAGYGTYEFKNFKTSSPVLAAQLMWMAEKALGQRVVLNVDRVRRGDKMYRYFSINLNTPESTGKGAHLKRDRREIKRVIPLAHRGYLFDLTTESGKFAAGVGNLLIHNSPRRGLEFVTHKVTYGAVKIKLGLADELRLGNLEARRDWGYAPDYVRAMWLMLQQDQPDDYVVATGETHSVRELCEVAFDYLGLDYRDYVVQDPRFYRPAEVDLLVGDASKARQVLGWEPTVTFEELVRIMVDADMENLQREMRGEKPVNFPAFLV